MDVTVESDRKMSDATWRAGATAVVRVTLADGEPQRTKQISRRFTVGARAGNCYHEDVGHATAPSASSRSRPVAVAWPTSSW